MGVNASWAYEAKGGLPTVLGVPGKPDRRAHRRRLAGRDDPGVRAAEASATAAVCVLAAERLLLIRQPPGGAGPNVVHGRMSPVRSEAGLTRSWSRAGRSRWASRSSALMVDRSRTLPSRPSQPRRPLFQPRAIADRSARLSWAMGGLEEMTPLEGSCRGESWDRQAGRSRH
jgi:hypothetical protein